MVLVFIYVSQRKKWLFCEPWCQCVLLTESDYGKLSQIVPCTYFVVLAFMDETTACGVCVFKGAGWSDIHALHALIAR